MSALRVFAAADVAALLDYPSLIDRLQEAFRLGCEAPLRHRHDLRDGTMLIKPAWRDGGTVAVKIVNVFSGNAARGLAAVQGTVMTFDGATGVPLAVMDGQALTNRRTAAASALASRFLSRADSAVHLIVGTGQLAPELARAHAAVRPLRQTLVWGRNPDKSKTVAAALARDGLAAHAVDDLAEAVGRADIVSCATLATSPLVAGAWLKPGTHLDLVGSFRPDMREADDAAVELAELCAGTVAGRGSDEEMTLFKSVGTALEDLAAAELVWERAAK